MTEPRRVWGFHGGLAAVPGSPFFATDSIGLSWVPKRDLANVGLDRQAFRDFIVEAWPERAAKGRNSVGSAAGQLYRFVHEMCSGDLVAFPLKRSDEVHLGLLTGGYRFAPNATPAFPHSRPVRWLGFVPKMKLTTGALRELGSVLAVFRIKTHAEEFISAVDALETRRA
jgi:restriction system protein